MIREAQDKRPYRTNFLSPDSTSTTHTKLRENYIERQLEVVFSLTAHDNTAQLPVVGTPACLSCLAIVICRGVCMCVVRGDTWPSEASPCSQSVFLES